MARKYTHIQKLLPEIRNMLKEGKSHREIETHFKLEGDRPIHNLLKRERRKEKKEAFGIVSLRRGRPRKDTELTDENKVAYYKRELQLQKYDNQRLKMENELLRDFLKETGRK